MFQYRSVLVRLRRGESDREVARGKTMGRRKLAAFREVAAAQGWLDPLAPMPEDAAIVAALGPAKRATSTISSLESFRPVVSEWLEQGVQGTTIHGALKRNHGDAGSYSSVYRLVRSILSARLPDATVPLLFAPAEAAQVDFGAGPMLADPDGVLRRTWAFVMTLCFSRHQYVEFVWDQTVPTWLGCHRRAFEWFGAVPGRLIIDNPKSAITRACRTDPLVQRAYEECAEGYGFKIDPCPPHDPQKKAWTSYCTLCGRLSGDEPSRLAAVAAANAMQELTTIGRLVQAAAVVAVEVARQHAFAAELMDGCGAHAELLGHLFAREHAALAQSFEAAAQLVGAANDANLLQRERLAAPIAVPEFIEPCGDLLIG